MRPRGKSYGYLRVEGTSWLGTWRRYQKNGTARRVTVVVGEAALTHTEAREKLDEIIRCDRLQNSAVDRLGPSSISAASRMPDGRDLPVNIGRVAELIVCTDLISKGPRSRRAIWRVRYFGHNEIGSSTFLIPYSDTELTRNEDSL